MAEAQSVLQRVYQLKERLGCAQDTKKIAKALKSLQELNISLDILVETGIGKIVNGFRKHADVGDVAKSLVNHWKKLVPEGKEHEKPKCKPDQKELVDEKKLSRSVSREKSTCAEKVCQSASDTKKCVKSSKTAESNTSKSKHLTKNEKSEKLSSNDHTSEKSKNPSHSSDHADSKRSDYPGKGTRVEKHSSSSVEKKKKHSPKDESKQLDKDSLKSKGSTSVSGMKQSQDKKPESKLTGDEDFDTPAMSFESYLNYDQISTKRKKRSCSLSEPPRKLQVCKQYCNVELSKAETIQTTENGETSENRESTEVKEEPDGHIKEVKVQSLTDLLNIPLPKFLPDYSILPSPPYITEHKGNVSEELTEQCCESSAFTGRRLNSKMLVYSGSKITYLPKMLTLYEQCIRVLQNNIDSIQEVGGVPFEILETVLERCTPEQLNRIEECNPAFIQDTGHLWKKHCDRDFKNHKLLEYESWREMYLRLFSEREEKLKMITQNISSAHSGKPKGRQVKLAYIHSAAKPPRNIRRRQEMHGTAGSIVQPHPLDKLKMQKLENKDTCVTTHNQNVPTNTATKITTTSYCGGPSQDPKRTVRRMAPMMAKSMRAFKNRVGPR
ncbi:elongin-A-like isoform X1 [Ascaphus truei]|uniref:elongin-A-like isoform X1 n=1 Tax=Ascaphus truei TaxID=8439 RepID=UPI003F5A45A1